MINPTLSSMEDIRDKDAILFIGTDKYKLSNVAKDINNIIQSDNRMANSITV